MKKRIITIVKTFCYELYSVLVFFTGFILLIAEPVDGNVYSITFLSTKVGAFTLFWKFKDIMDKRYKQVSNEKVE